MPLTSLTAVLQARFDGECVRSWLRSLVPEADDRLRRPEEVLARVDRPT